MKIETCPWWIRRSHQRLRYRDLETMWRTLYERADTAEEARVAWEVFRAQEGQGHWQCPCSRPLVELFKSAIIAVVE